MPGEVATITGAHTVNLTADHECADLTVNGTLNIGNHNLTITSNLSGTGVINMGTGTLSIADDNITFSGTFSAGNGTVDFNRGGNQSIPAYTYHNLITSNSGTKTMSGAIQINGDLTIGAGTTLDVNDASDFTITIRGNWLHTGTFNEHQGTVIFSGGNFQTITANPNETFHNLTIDKTEFPSHR